MIKKISHMTSDPEAGGIMWRLQGTRVADSPCRGKRSRQERQNTWWKKNENEKEDGSAQ